MALVLVGSTKANPTRGAALRKVREAQGISVQEMSVLTGWTDRQIRNWEAGRSPFKRAVIVAYAMAGEPSDRIDSAVRFVDAPEAGPPDGDPASQYAPWDLNPEPADPVNVLPLAA